MSAITRAEVCIVACADAWRDAGEILLSPFGTIPQIGARLARATFSPDILLTNGEAMFAAGVWPMGEAPEAFEGWIPYRGMFDLLWTGRRHVMMIPSQLDRYGNANISFIGDDSRRPVAQLVGVRGAPGNTVNHPTSYWVPRHTPRAFVTRVDMISGVGYDSAARAGAGAQRYHDLRCVVTDLAVFDFGGPERLMRLVSLHPGVSLEEVRTATGFAFHVDGDIGESRLPDARELELIREVIDPSGAREREVPR